MSWYFVSIPYRSGKVFIPQGLPKHRQGLPVSIPYRSGKVFIPRYPFISNPGITTVLSQSLIDQGRSSYVWQGSNPNSYHEVSIPYRSGKVFIQALKKALKKAKAAEKSQSLIDQGRSSYSPARCVLSILSGSCLVSIPYRSGKVFIQFTTSCGDIFSGSVSIPYRSGKVFIPYR